MNLIDTHCHLDYFLPNIEDVLHRAKNAFVSQFISCGTEAKDWPKIRLLAEKFQNVHYTVGIHPSNVSPNWEKDLAILSDFFSQTPKPIAVGEIGLDYHFLAENAQETISLQKEVFRQQLHIANQNNCPVIVHSREAFGDCVKIIEESRCDWTKIVIHCFSESADDIKFLNDRGGRGSFTGIVTYKNAEKVRAAMLKQGLEKLMLETDSPYLAPVPFRSQQNEPAFLRETAIFSAKFFGIPEQELCRITTQNATEFFNLP